MLASLDRNVRLAALADHIEHFVPDHDFNLGCSIFCGYGHACRLFGETLRDGSADAVPHFAEMMGLTHSEAAAIYGGSFSAHGMYASRKDTADYLRSLRRPCGEPSAKRSVLRKPRARVMEVA